MEIQYLYLSKSQGQVLQIVSGQEESAAGVVRAILRMQNTEELQKSELSPWLKFFQIILIVYLIILK